MISRDGDQTLPWAALPVLGNPLNFTPSQLGVVFRLPVHALSPLIQITDEDNEENSPQHIILGNPTCGWPPVQHNL